MIKKITIDNFMAHEHTELELGAGVTILTGSNNTGKSAVVEALRCVATNPTPSHFIRHGAKEARVGVEMEDGTRVVWVRTRRWAMYELWHPGAEEPEEYHKLQRKVPEDIRKILRMNLVDLETSSKSVDIHIGNQREPVFLLNRPDSDTAAFFAASTESAHLLAMQDLLKMQTRDKKREAKALEAEIVRIENDIDKLASLPDIELVMEEARDLEAEAVGYEREIPALASMLSQCEVLSATLGVRKSVVKVLDKAEVPPQLNETRILADTIENLSGVARFLGMAEKASGALDPLEAPPMIEDTPALARVTHGIAATGRTLQKVAGQNGVLTGLEDVPELEKTAELARFMDEYIALGYRASRLDRWNTVLQNVAEPPLLEPEGELGALLAGMRDLTGRKQGLERDLSTLDDGLRNVVDRLSERIDQLGKCPTCGHDLTADEFLDHGCRNEA